MPVATLRCVVTSVVAGVLSLLRLFYAIQLDQVLAGEGIHSQVLTLAPPGRRVCDVRRVDLFTAGTREENTKCICMCILQACCKIQLLNVGIFTRGFKCFSYG